VEASRREARSRSESCRWQTEPERAPARASHRARPKEQPTSAS
jgi:hypothetical protein